VSAHALEWLELTVRWLHVIAGVAWIGTSFYFNWLNDALEAPRPRERAPEGDPPEALEGEAWEVHGGGFYRAQKFSVKLGELPERLHWFRWEAYGTWISGFAMLVLVYYLGAEVYMVDPSVAGIGPNEAVGIGIGALVASWLVYDALCRSPLARRTGLFAAAGFLLATGLAFGLTRVLGSRAAYIHVGAALGTLMAANVFRVIIPAHHELVDALEEDREPDPAVGKHAAMRSRHNNYLTLPVLFIMVSHHYPGTYGHEHGWAILAAIFLIGAGTRHYFNLRNQGVEKRWILPAAAAGLIGLAFLTAPSGSGGEGPAATAGAGSGAGGGVGDVGGDVAAAVRDSLFREARAVIERRCTPCHARRPGHRLFSSPPSGVLLETSAQIRARATQIRTQAVERRTMPLGNFTQMTDGEREVLDRWTRRVAGDGG